MNNANPYLTDIKKYANYYLETRGYTSDTGVKAIGNPAYRAAGAARGNERGPAIVIQGIMPRSGTVYVGELLRRHPTLYAFPHQLWEFPALQLAGDIRKLQEAFLRGYKPNRGKLAEDDFLPLIGAALIAYLYEPVPPQRRVLAKMAGVQYLTLFFSMFPHENLLILIRDGRDLVHSTLRTWPRLNFIQVCLRWNRSAQVVLRTLERLEGSPDQGYWMAKYEDSLEDPYTFVKEACRRFGLDERCYPFEQIDEIRVIGSSKLEHERQKEVTWRHLQRPAGFRPMDYWKQWSALKKLIFKAIAGRSLIELGYCEDLKW